MGKKTNRRHAPMTVAEAQDALIRAQRREAAQQTTTRRPARVDLATLDTPEIAHGDLIDDFMFRPGTFYIADIAIPAIVNADGESFTATTTLKATDEQLPYLVEVLRQVRGALGETCRISLAAAEPTTEQPPAGRYGFQEHFAQTATRAAESTASVADAHQALEAAQRAAAARARATVPDGPPMVPGLPGGPWMPAEDREYSRDELAAQLPGRTRADVAQELGKAPEDIGGTYNADMMPEELAAQIGVPVESLRRIPMTGGGYVWSVVPQAPEPSGRYAAMDTHILDEPDDPRAHAICLVSSHADAEGSVASITVECMCGSRHTAHNDAAAREKHAQHQRGELRAGR
ncbi:hypothetical protein [Mycolicibacterium llatzerense]|uniref:hypothetical protein n=1 Tax=Mycolicibacterium llatzerense TaxID=280871 RepID=UPI0021B6A1E5|nr:hypothetical protein [Mycolicibacterium llatzerense]MCT7372718.1 hypothetical protein [Mycolicibacterium llatzerense]